MRRGQNPQDHAVSVDSITNGAISNPSVSAICPESRYRLRASRGSGLRGFVGLTVALSPLLRISDSVSNHIDTMSDDIHENAASMREGQRRRWQDGRGNTMTRAESSVHSWLWGRA